jgi:hypothetical protein
MEYKYPSFKTFSVISVCKAHVWNFVLIVQNPCQIRKPVVTAVNVMTTICTRRVTFVLYVKCNMLANSCVAALNTDNILSVTSTFKVIDCFIRCNALLAKEKHRFQVLLAMKISMLVFWKAVCFSKIFVTTHSSTRRYNLDLKMEVVCFFETLVSTYRSTWRHNPALKKEAACLSETTPTLSLPVLNVILRNPTLQQNHLSCWYKHKQSD